MTTESDNSKICFILPTFLMGGMERIMSELANYFDNKGIEVHVIFLIDHCPFFEVTDNVKLHFPRLRHDMAQTRNGLYWIKILRYIRKTVKAIRPDSVFSIPQGYSLLSIIALLNTKIPVYISDRNSPNKKLNMLRRTLRKFLYPLADGIIAQTEFAKTSLLMSGVRNKNIIVIPNPLKKIRVHPKINPSKKVVLNIGRLVAEKNQSELIRIFSLIDLPDWKLHIVGNGPLKDVLTQQIRDLKMEDRVTLIDGVKDVDKEMAQAEIFAFTSLYEGFPNSLHEAMAYPLACIAYDCIAGPGEIINDGVNGFLIEMGNSEKFRRKLEMLMEDEILRRKFADVAKLNREKYSLEFLAEKYLRFLTNK